MVWCLLAVVRVCLRDCWVVRLVLLCKSVIKQASTTLRTAYYVALQHQTALQASSLCLTAAPLTPGCPALPVRSTHHQIGVWYTAACAALCLLLPLVLASCVLLLATWLWAAVSCSSIAMTPCVSRMGLSLWIGLQMWLYSNGELLRGVCQLQQAANAVVCSCSRSTSSATSAASRFARLSPNAAVVACFLHAQLEECMLACPAAS